MDYHYPTSDISAEHPHKRRVKPKRKQRLRIQSGTRTIDIVNAWDGGFALSRSGPQPKRGVVDLFNGARHIRHGLVYQTGATEELVLYTFKLAQDPRMAQPADFERAPDGPVALIPNT